MSFGVPAAPPAGAPPYPADPAGSIAAAVVLEARGRIHEAAPPYGVFYSGNSTNEENVIERIDCGIKFSFATEESARSR